MLMAICLFISWGLEQIKKITGYNRLVDGVKNNTMKTNISQYLVLLGINLIYALVFVFTKSASVCPFLSWQYILWLIGAVCVMGIYAIIWQQVIKRIEMGTAYMFKGTALIFTLFFSVLLFGESITWNNIIGAIIIVSGIVLFSNDNYSSNMERNV